MKIIVKWWLKFCHFVIYLCLSLSVGAAYVVECVPHQLTPENNSLTRKVELNNNAKFSDPPNYYLYGGYSISVPSGMKARVRVVIKDKAEALCTAGLSVRINRLDYSDYSDYKINAPMEFDLTEDASVFICPYVASLDTAVYIIGYDSVLGHKITKIVNAPTSRFSMAILYEITVHYYEKARTYDIVYRKGYGTGTDVTDKKESGKTIKLRDAMFTRTGFTQTGWSKNVSGNKKDYNLGANYSLDESLTLYPYWTVRNTSPVNDNFASATSITGSSGAKAGTNVRATRQSGEPLLNKFSSATTTVWWKWTAPTSGTATFSTVGSAFDTQMGIYTGSSLSSLSLVKADDDRGANRTSICTFACTSGRTYYPILLG